MIVKLETVIMIWGESLQLTDFLGKDSVTFSLQMGEFLQVRAQWKLSNLFAVLPGCHFDETTTEKTKILQLSSPVFPSFFTLLHDEYWVETLMYLLK